MEFAQGREGYHVEEMIGNIGKFPSSSSSSPSSSQYNYKGVIHQQNGRWEAPQKHQEDRAILTNFNQAVEPSMDLSPSNHNIDVGRKESECGSTSCGVGRVEKEHMFDKVVTPSDVGKLNRLVIPKQHAEKYFPLDSSANEKGLLLNFEDRSGKPWRFRYSYWNSSQSYVMTKGWSRFVKEKKLDAGDIVSFERGVGESAKDRLYIDWKRRPDAPNRSSLPHQLALPRSVPWGRLFMPQPIEPTPVQAREHLYLQQQLNYHNQHYHRSSSSSSSYSGSNYGYNVVTPCPGSFFYLRSSSAPLQVGAVVQQGGDVPMVFDSVPVVHGKAAAKRLRLFGVNLECPISEDQEPECDILSSTMIPRSTMASLSPLQLRLFNGSPLPTMSTQLPKQRKPSMSFDLDI